MLVNLSLLLFITSTGNTETFNLLNGWNLLSSRVEIDVSSVFGDKDKFISIWKWVINENNKTWAVYLPGMNTQAYADAKGFSVLTTSITINAP